MGVTFGGYCLDLGTRQLLLGQTEVRLSPKAFDLLRVLASPLGLTCWIVWKDGELRLSDGENIIRCDPAASVRLDFPSASRRHARIVVSADGAAVEDLGSKNGTLLRKERVTGTDRLPGAPFPENPRI
jgi:FHA domain